MTSSSLQSLKQEPDKLIEIILRQAAAVEELSKEIQELKKQNEELKQQICDLNDRNDGLSSKVEELEKSAARQAAPFRIADKKRKTNPGGLSQALARLARKWEPAYEKLLARLRDGPYVHSDETS
jgi:predicted nuclease with TOPRIM domain